MNDVESNILGRAYQYLIRTSAEGQGGQSAGEFYHLKHLRCGRAVGPGIVLPVASRDGEEADTAWLEFIAAKLGKALQRSSKLSIHPESSRTTDTGGWSVRLGESRGASGTKIEIWFDRYFGPTRPRIFWFGFRWLSRPPFLKAFGRWHARMRKEFQITNRDISFQRRSRTYALRQPRPTHKPHLERYPPEYYFGIFWPRAVGVEGERALVREVVDFLNKAILADGRINLSLAAPKALRDIAVLEERHEAKERELFRRSPELANGCKARDDYICQICRFDFATRYPSIVPGRIGPYAEAHHIVPLHKRKTSAPITIKHLVTVCANCHRMLHRLQGTPSDLRALRSMVRKAKLSH